MNEVTQFLKDTEQSQGVDILDQPLNPEEQAQPPAPAEETPEGDEPTGDEEEGKQLKGDDEEPEDVEPLKPKNRRERRLRQRLEAERQSAMQLAERLETMSSAQRAIEEADYMKGLDRIYGNDTPEAQMATDLLKQAFSGAVKDAEERAYARVAQERQQAAQQEADAQAELDGFIDEIEDTYNVELSETQERSYFQLLHKMSPKDKNGNVIGYADPHSVWEVFQERSKKKAPANTKAKAIASRSLKQGGTPEPSKIQDDSTVRFLKENGII